MPTSRFRPQNLMEQKAIKTKNEKWKNENEPIENPLGLHLI